METRLTDCLATLFVNFEVLHMWDTDAYNELTDEWFRNGARIIRCNNVCEVIELEARVCTAWETRKREENRNIRNAALMSA